MYQRHWVLFYRIIMMNVTWFIYTSLSPTSPYPTSLAPNYSFKRMKNNYHFYFLFPYKVMKTNSKIEIRKIFVTRINGLIPSWEVFAFSQYGPRNSLVAEFTHYDRKENCGKIVYLIEILPCFLCRIRWIIERVICIFTWNRISHFQHDEWVCEHGF